MKITVIIGRYPPVFGGATPTLITLFSEIVKRGHDVIFLTPMYSSDHSKYDTQNGIKVIRIPPGLNNGLSELWFGFKSILYLIKFKLNPDIIIDTIPYAMSMPVLQSFAKFNKIPLVARLSQIGTNEPMAAKRGKTGLIKRFFINSYDFTICISTALEKQCRLAGLKRNKYSKIYNCVDTKRFSPFESKDEANKKKMELLKGASSPIVIVPGSVIPRKRSHLALAAWKIIKQQYKLDGILVFVGPLKSYDQQFNNNYVSNILNNVQKNGLQDSVFFTDHKDNIDEYYKISDLVLFVSNREGLPNVLLECMSCGLPVVCTKINNITNDIIEDGAEGLYSTDDPNDIAKKLSILMKDDKLRLKMAMLCKDKINKEFNVSLVTNKIESLLIKSIEDYKV